MTITLTHRSPDLYATEMSGAEGALIDSLRDDCGYVIQGIDWVTRKVGFDLIGSIFDPIAGDFGTVDAMSASWASAGTALGDISANYGSMVTALPEAWEGPGLLGGDDPPAARSRRPTPPSRRRARSSPARSRTCWR